jgi:hypothetical protein
MRQAKSPARSSENLPPPLRQALSDCSHIALANVCGPRQDPHGEAGVVSIFATRCWRTARPGRDDARLAAPGPIHGVHRTVVFSADRYNRGQRGAGSPSRTRAATSSQDAS